MSSVHMLTNNGRSSHVISRVRKQVDGCVRNFLDPAEPLEWDAGHPRASCAAGEAGHALEFSWEMLVGLC